MHVAFKWIHLNNKVQASFQVLQRGDRSKTKIKCVLLEKFTRFASRPMALYTGLFMEGRPMMRRIVQFLLPALFLALLSMPARSDPQGDFAKAKQLEQDGNLTEAFELYRSAATQGHVEAQLQLGRAHANGLGVPQNFKAAYVWYDVAVKNGSNPGIYGRRNAEKKMSDEEIAEAKTLAQRCNDSGYQDCE